jgi:hypothetical protein
MAELSMNELAGVANEGAVADTVVPSSRDSRGWARIMSLPVLAGVVAACSGGGSSDAPVDSLPAKPSTTIVETTDAPTTSIGDPVVVDTSVVPSTTETTVVETTTTVDLFAETYFGFVCNVPGVTDQPAATNLPESALPIAVLAIPQDKTSVEYRYLESIVFSAITNGSQMTLAVCPDGPAAGQEVVVIVSSIEAQQLPSVTSIAPDGSTVVNQKNLDVLQRVLGTEAGEASFFAIDPDRPRVGSQRFVPSGEVGDRLPQLRSFSEFGDLLREIEAGNLLEAPELVEYYSALMDDAARIEASNLANGTAMPVPMFAVVPAVLVESEDRSAAIAIANSLGEPIDQNEPVQFLLVAPVDSTAFGNPLIRSDGYYPAFAK